VARDYLPLPGAKGWGKSPDWWEGCAEVYLPDALARKFPNAAKDWRWQYFFPSGRLSTDPRGGVVRRHQVHENALSESRESLCAPGGYHAAPGDPYPAVHPLVRPGLAMVA
jgi:hypothetical protein